jgi:hypothetical protein
MTAPECVREHEILDEIAEGRWPEAAPVALREHAAACAVCADLALAVSALHDDAADAKVGTMALPSAGQVWWRAELRARHDAARLAQRPVIAVQVVAAVVFLAAVVTGVRSLAPEAWTWLLRAAGAARTANLATLDSWSVALILSVGLWVVAGPIAIYMVVRADRQGGR